MASALFSERYASLVEELISARKIHGVTQVELARRLSKPQSFVSKIERRERRIDLVEFYDWANALNIDPHDLFRSVTNTLKGRK